MNYYMTPNVVVYLKIVGAKTERLLLDTVAGIMYEAQGGKIPVFSHHSIEFDAIAEGRSLISGLLVVNKGYKDMIAGVVAGLGSAISSSSQANTQVTIDKLETIDINNSSYISFLQLFIQHLEEFKDSNPILLGGRIDRPGQWDTAALMAHLVDLNTFMTNSTGQPGYTQYLDMFNVLVDGTGSLIEDGDLSNIAINNYINVLSGNQPQQARLAQDTNIQLVDSIDGLIERINTELSTIQESVNGETIDLQQELASQLANVTQLTIPKIYGSDLFNSLRLKGYKIQLILQFGDLHDAAGGNHEVIINDCYFASESVNVSIDNRDNIRESFAFIAKSIS